MARLASAPMFKVIRCEPELVSPASPTPHEFKLLSDIDDQEGVRFQIHTTNFYKENPSSLIQRRDPVMAIREALSRALVYYYPLAGRLRQVPGGRKLVVDCTGEGVLFIEADADADLHQFGDPIVPPFPCLDQLLFDVPGSAGILHSPLLLVQVTRLKCGGFVFALRVNHTICDGTGILQFMNAVAEMARGASSPSIPPVWQRSLLCARDPPYMTYTHHEFDSLDDSNDVVFPFQDMAHASFFFCSTDISAIKKQHAFRSFSTFEVLTACIWRCAIRALHLNSDIQVRTVFPVNIRDKFSPPIPKGYYGNAYTLAMAITTAGQLCENPLEYALELVKSTKANITEVYMRSLIDLLVIKGKPSHTSVGASYVSDLVSLGFDEVDFGWGKAVYGGRAKVWGGAKARVASLFSPLKDHRGEKGIVVSIYLPNWAVERFADEVGSIINASSSSSSSSRIIRTAL